MAEDFFPFVENRQDFSDAEIADPTTSARIAIYDDMVMPPHVVMVEPSDIRTYLAEITKTVYELVIPHCAVWSFQVIRELVENLIHASFAEPTISILDKGKTIAVCDQGPGIPNKTAALKPSFSSATSPMKRFIRGVGSGLPIVEEWIKLHNGTLTIEDNLGRGTTVTVSLAQTNVGGSAASQQGLPAATPGYVAGQAVNQTGDPLASHMTSQAPNPYTSPYGGAYENPYGYRNAYGSYYPNSHNPYGGPQGTPGYSGYPSYQVYPAYQGYPGSGYPVQQPTNAWVDTRSPYGGRQPGTPDRPTYGQLPYGQATYGQSPYGQEAYGQAVYGQTAYGQPGTQNVGGADGHNGIHSFSNQSTSGMEQSEIGPIPDFAPGTPGAVESGIEAHAPLTKDQRDILLLFGSLEKIGPKELTEQLGISAPTASRKLREISEAGFIIKKGAKYILTGEGSRMFAYLSSDGR